MDHQVQICGYRVELGEIEAVLREHPKVRETVVVPVATDRGEIVLAGAFMGPSVGPAPLLDRLRSQLPEHMIRVLDRSVNVE